MPQTMEEILGGPIPKERPIPGSVPSEDREWWYVEVEGSSDFKGLFRALVRAVQPAIPASGGAMDEGCELTLPDGRKFHALSYRGDLAGWRKQIAEGAEKVGVKAVLVVDGDLVFSGAERIPVANCTARFY